MTLIEVMVATAAGLVVLVAVVAIVSGMVSGAAKADAKVQSHAAVDGLAERLESEAAGAWAVYVPATDATGADNSDGHAVAFYAQDGSHKTYGWQYVFDAQSGDVTRYAYDPANIVATAQNTETIPGITAFSAQAATANDVVGNSRSTAYDPLFAGATVTAATVVYPQGPPGGNGVVAVSIGAPNGDASTLRLASGTAPSSFTVVVTFTPSPAPAAPPTATPGAITTPSSTSPTPTPPSSSSAAPPQTPTPIPVTPAPTATPTAGPVCAPPYVIGTGQTCPIANASQGYSNDTSLDCAAGGGSSGGIDDTYFFATPSGGSIPFATGGTITDPDVTIAYNVATNTLTATRTAPGTVTLDIVDHELLPGMGGRFGCIPRAARATVYTYTFN